MSEKRTLGMGELEQIAHRPFRTAPFADGTLAAQATHGNIVVLTADLGKYTDVHPFRDAHPTRYFNVGMAEQALVSVAAGLSKSGQTAYCTTYGAFATRRAHDFLAIACAHSRENVKMFAGNPGLTTGYGGTHQAIEDLALMSAIPDMTVIDPCDATEMAQVAEMAAEIEGTVYVRLLRGNVPVVFDPATFRFSPGKAQRFGTGSDVGLVATGFMTERCLDAATALRAQGVSVSVLHMSTIKPFDTEGLLHFATNVDRLVTAENHVLAGGLAARVTDALYRARVMRPLLSVAIPDSFIECGSLPYLQGKYGLSTERLLSQIQDWLASRASAA